MKQLEKEMKQLEESYQQVVHDWVSIEGRIIKQMQHEEEHKRRETELLEENKQLRTEKNEIEKNLRK